VWGQGRRSHEGCVGWVFCGGGGGNIDNDAKRGGGSRVLAVVLLKARRLIKDRGWRRGQKSGICLEELKNT